jgi:ABC-type protease/lipase transport system fused ATPase/permease subunit
MCFCRRRKGFEGALKVERLCVEHSKTKRQLIKDVGFSIRPSESLVVFGQSG